MFNDNLMTSNVGTLNANGPTQGSKFVDKYPVMDEECRKDLPLQTSDSRKQFGTTSPHKSVRFSEAEADRHLPPNIHGSNLLASPDSNMPLSDQKSSASRGSKRNKRQRSPDSEEEEDYDDEDESDEEGESDDEVLDQELQNKIENIKKNLKDNQSSGAASNVKSGGGEDTINRLEEVLKRQRERLDNMTMTGKSGSF